MNKKHAVILGAFVFLFAIFLFLKSSTTVLLGFEVGLDDDIGKTLSAVEGLETTFFVTGQYAERFPEEVSKIIEGGHEVACNSYSYPVMTRLELSEKKRQILKCLDAIERVTGKKPLGFRAPWNQIDDETLSLLSNFGFVYDASMIDNLEIFYPLASAYGLVEVPVSSFSFIALDDSLWKRWGLGSVFYSALMKKKGVVSVTLHSSNIDEDPESFINAISHFKRRNARFISHESFVTSDNNG